MIVLSIQYKFHCIVSTVTVMLDKFSLVNLGIICGTKAVILLLSISEPFLYACKKHVLF